MFISLLAGARGQVLEDVQAARAPSDHQQRRRPHCAALLHRGERATAARRLLCRSAPSYCVPALLPRRHQGAIQQQRDVRRPGGAGSCSNISRVLGFLLIIDWE